MSDEAAQREPDARERARRRRRLAEVFGDGGPDQTSDDRADPGDSSDGSRSDEWLRQQVPPHHG